MTIPAATDQNFEIVDLEDAEISKFDLKPAEPQSRFSTRFSSELMTLALAVSLGGCSCGGAPLAHPLDGDQRDVGVDLAQPDPVEAGQPDPVGAGDGDGDGDQGAAGLRDGGAADSSQPPGEPCTLEQLLAGCLNDGDVATGRVCRCQ